MLTGLSLIKDGNLLGYPWKLTFNSLARNCDKVLISCGSLNDLDKTRSDLKYMSWYYDNIDIHFCEWDMKNTGDGSELAKQINLLLPSVETEWCIYLQADEIIRDEDYQNLKILLASVPKNITQIELFRTYFWENIDTRVPEYELYLGRVFKTKTHTVGGDGMYLNRLEGEVYRTEIPIFHYSRMGKEEIINKRIRNLDKLFHDEKIVSEFPKFSFEEIPNTKRIINDLPHPPGIREFYK